MYDIAWISLFFLVIFGISIEFLFKKTYKFLIIIWILISIVYYFIISALLNKYESSLYLVSYLLEISLSLDNILVFLLIFKQFSISFNSQEKAIAIGSYSALILRFVFVFVGIELLSIFEFGSILLSLLVLFSAYELGRSEFANRDEKEHEESRILVFLKKYFKENDSNNEPRLFIRKNGKVYPTKFLLAIIAIEITDIIFAFDSIPAIVLLTKNELISYSSTIMGTMIIRSFYFNINRSLSNLRHVEGFLAVGLGFIGISSIMESIGKILKINYFIIPQYISVSVIVLIIVAGLIYSLIENKRGIINANQKSNDNRWI